MIDNGQWITEKVMKIEVAWPRKGAQSRKWIFIPASPSKAWRRRMLRGHSFGGSPSIRVKNSK